MGGIHPFTHNNREDKVVVQPTGHTCVFGDKNPHPDYISNESDESCERYGFLESPW